MAEVLAWTREQPTESGWYWVRTDIAGSEAGIAFVEVYGEPARLAVWQDGKVYAASVNFIWSGPLRAPTGAVEGILPS